MEKTNRKSGIELLRIICMMQIIVLHIYNFGGVTVAADRLGGTSDKIADLIWSFCRCPVYVFIIITGYFLSQREMGLRDIKKRVLNIYKPMIFYSVTISAAFLIFAPRYLKKITGGTTSEVLKTLTPFFSRTWYFLTLFIIVIALAPYINIALQKISKREYLFLLFSLLVIFSVWPVLSSLAPFKSFISVKAIVAVEKGKSLYCFILMYIIGGYLKRFVPEKGKFEPKYLLIFAACSLSDFALHLAFPDKVNGYGAVFGWFSNPFVIFEAISLFLLFRSISFKCRFINFVSSGVLGVYMIHEFRFVREYLWSRLSFKDWNGDISYLIIRITLIVIAVFAVCNAIEQLRIFIFGRMEKLFKKSKSKE